MTICDPQDIALKSFFLGPQSENSNWVRMEILKVIDEWFDWRRRAFPDDGYAITPEDQSSSEFIERQKEFGRVVENLYKRFENETPKFTPRYIGHMISELSLSGILGHLIALLHNPNNASKEVATVSESIEKEAIGFLACMIGFNHNAQGHFTSGGTIANFEAMWRARYRLDHWHSLCAYLRSHANIKMTSYEGSHLGWDKYHELMRSEKISENNLKPFSFVIQGPWAYQKSYRKWFDDDFLGPVILVPGNKHYSWQKGTSLIGLGESSFVSIDLDSKGKLCLKDLRDKIETCRSQDHPILMVVSVAGTTELGDIDPVDEVQDYLDELKHEQNIHIWHHVDAAYGGFFASLQENIVSILGQKVASAFEAIKRVDSVTLDPHKLGYVPYSCGAIVVPTKIHNTVSSFHAPYLNNIRDDSQAWSSTIEGSRPGSGAAATWLTAKTLTFSKGGLGRILEKGILARDELRMKLCETSPLVRVLKHCDTNIVCFSVALEEENLSNANRRTEKVFQSISNGSEFAVSKTTLSTQNQFKLIKGHISQFKGSLDCESLVLIRTVLMNPFIISKNVSISYIDEFCKVVKSLIG